MHRFVVLTGLLALTPLACSKDSPPAASSASSSGSSSGASSSSSGESSSSSSSGESSSSSSTGGVPGPTVTQENLSVAGVPRKYTLSVPATYDKAKRYALVLSFHGDGGDGVGFRGYHTFEAASGDSAIVAYPDGINRTWNITSINNNGDVAFVEALIDELAAKYSIDKGRVLADGWSNGGFFVARIACNKSTLVKAISMNAGGAPFESDGNPHERWPNGAVKCPGQGAVPAFVTHGTNDGSVGFDSGSYAAQYFGEIGGCTGPRTPTTPAPCVTQGSSCPAKTKVVFCPISGIGHGIWSEASKNAWAFFESLP
jgi:polyhydroxybutyrate depolymerase